MERILLLLFSTAKVRGEEKRTLWADGHPMIPKQKMIFVSRQMRNLGVRVRSGTRAGVSPRILRVRLDL